MLHAFSGSVPINWSFIRSDVTVLHKVAHGSGVNSMTLPDPRLKLWLHSVKSTVALLPYRGSETKLHWEAYSITARVFSLCR